MTIKEIKEKANGEYITNPEDWIKGKSREETIVILQNIITYNNQFLLQLKKRKEELQKTRHINPKEKTIIPSPSVEENYQIPKQEYLQETDHETSFLLKKLKNAQSLDEIIQMIPIEQQQRQKLQVAIYQEIVFCTNLTFELAKTSTKEELESFQKEIHLLQKIFDLITKPKEKEEKKDSVEKPTIIYLTTANGKNCIISDLEKLPPELYKHFEAIFTPFVEGKELKLKKLNSNDSITTFELKNTRHQARFTLQPIGQNCYLMTSAFNKKTDFERYLRVLLQNRTRMATIQIPMIKEQIQNPEFLIQQEEETEKIMTLLHSSHKGGK